MSTAFYHRHDHAVIVFAGTLQWTDRACERNGLLT